MDKTKSNVPFIFALLLFITPGCATVRVTSCPSGATVYRSFRDSATGTPHPAIDVMGMTPCSYRSSWIEEAAKVRWPDGYESAWKFAPRDWWGFQSKEFHFVRPDRCKEVSGAAFGSKPLRQSDMKHCNSHVQCLKEGKASFDQGRYSEALNHLTEAIRLDPSNHGAYVLSGVAYARIGKGDNARSSFEKTIEVAPNSGNAARAREWLERLNHPLAIAILPIKIESSIRVLTNWESRSKFGAKEKVSTRAISAKKNFDEIVRRSYYNRLAEVLSDCGFYSTTRGKRSWVRKACADFRRLGTKIAVVGRYTRIHFEEDTSRFVNFFHGSPIGVLRIMPGVDSVFEMVCSFKISIHVSIDIYETKTCRLVETLDRSQVKEGVYSTNIESTLQQMFDTVFEQIALGIHHTLL